MTHVRDDLQSRKHTFAKRVFGGAANEEELFRLDSLQAQRGRQPMGRDHLETGDEAEQVIGGSRDISGGVGGGADDVRHHRIVGGSGIGIGSVVEGVDDEGVESRGKIGENARQIDVEPLVDTGSQDHHLRRRRRGLL